MKKNISILFLLGILISFNLKSSDCLQAPGAFAIAKHLAKKGNFQKLARGLFSVSLLPAVVAANFLLAREELSINGSSKISFKDADWFENSIYASIHTKENESLQSIKELRKESMHNLFM